MYKKIFNDELNDPNKRRRERRAIIQGQKQDVPGANDKEKYEPPEEVVIPIVGEDGEEI